MSLKTLLILVLQSTVNYVTEAKLNVLFIVVDDLRPFTVGNVNLPNINKLAGKGVNFENAFAQQALCAPSRNSMLTGRRPDTLRLYDFYSYWRDVAGNYTTLPQYFKEHGYVTHSVGKVFHYGASSNFTSDFPYSWTHKPYIPSTVDFKDAPVCNDSRSRKLHANLICPVDVNEQPRRTLPDLQSLNYAKNVLKASRKNNKPFFLAVGFYKPHIPFKFPRKYVERVPIGTVHPPKHPGIPERMPKVAWHPWMDIRKRHDISRLRLDFPYGLMPRNWSIAIKQSYFAAALYIDDLIGELLQHVNRSNTLIVLTSDHGWSLGENGLWAKYSNFDVALKVPLIFAAPHLRSGTVRNPVELVDIFPTVVKLAGLPNNIPKCRRKDESPLCFEGKSLVPFMKVKRRNKTKSFHTHSYAISQYPRPGAIPRIDSDEPRLKDIKIMGYSIRTERFRYTEWISFNKKLFTLNWNKIYGVELYDHAVDPEEYNNLHLIPKYKDVESFLANLLRSQVDPK